VRGYPARIEFIELRVNNPNDMLGDVCNRGATAAVVRPRTTALRPRSLTQDIDSSIGFRTSL
jgi:hypothetical protein